MNRIIILKDYVVNHKFHKYKETVFYDTALTEREVKTANKRYNNYTYTFVELTKPLSYALLQISLYSGNKRKYCLYNHCDVYDSIQLAEEAMHNFMHNINTLSKITDYCIKIYEFPKDFDSLVQENNIEGPYCVDEMIGWMSAEEMLSTIFNYCRYKIYTYNLQCELKDVAWKLTDTNDLHYKPFVYYNNFEASAPKFNINDVVVYNNQQYRVVDIYGMLGDPDVSYFWWSDQIGIVPVDEYLEDYWELEDMAVIYVRPFDVTLIK